MKSDEAVIKIKKLDERAEIPKYAHGHGEDAGFDLKILDGVRLNPNEPVMCGIGLAFEIPVGYEMQLRSRSGLALKGVVVANSPGTVDSGYRGEIKVILLNVGRNPVEFNGGERACQAVIARTVSAKFEVQEELSDTVRGIGGFGSTGV